ncbi:MAG TPA: rRNA maturation RNase YbeY [Actinobacteria bacterium]|nr:rRNA maturation RNase YbeY [Actinomycetota bacterium]
MEILISDRQNNLKIDALSLKELAEFTLVFEEVDNLAELSMVFVDEEEIERLNSQYRGAEEPTDVLSFPLFDKVPQEKTEHLLMLGDVVICPSVARRNALEMRRSLEKELNMLLVHGILHLLGYDHIEPKDEILMKMRQKEILKKFAQSRSDNK